MAHAITDVGSPRLERAVHVRKYRDLFNCDMGQLIPIQADLIMPGDLFKIQFDVVTRVQPLVAPILQQMDVDIHVFFCPIRIVDEDFADDENGTLSGGVYRKDDPDKDPLTGLTTKVFPRWEPETNPPAKYSLWDYMGHPLTNVGAPFPTDWHRRAYFKIYNDFYRNQHLEKELDINDLSNENILYRAFRKDYFTSALPTSQEGVPPALPITGETSAEFDDAPINSFIANTLATQYFHMQGQPNLTALATDAGRVVNFGDIGIITGQIIGQPGTYANGAGIVRDNGYVGDPANMPNDGTLNAIWRTTNPQSSNVYTRTGIKTNKDLINWLNNNTVDLSTLGTFDVNDLRDVIQKHKFMERNSRIGMRYVEQLQGRWRVSPRDERLQRPEFIGGHRIPVIISEVLQTSQTTQGSAGSPQGNLAGHGLVAGHGGTRKYHAKEWGYVISILSIMPKVGYSQGIDRQYLYESRYDFPAPEFMHLGEREVKTTELYTTSNEVENRAIWGYRPMYDELRLAQDRVCGDMRDIFNYWHLNREFDKSPLLNKEFITTENNIRKDIFAVQNEPGFIVHAGIKMKMVRSLPKLGEPGLMDHF